MSLWDRFRRGLERTREALVGVVGAALGRRTVDAATVAVALERAGWLVAARSRHLLERNWLQLCLMGEVSARDLDGLADTLANPVHHSA